MRRRDLRRFFARSLVVVFLAASAHAQSIFTVAGGGLIGDGRPATEALLNQPYDSAIDAAGNLYISDTKNQRIRRVDAKTGIISTYAGGGTSGRGDGGPAVEAALLDPSGLAIDSEGNLYIGSGIAGGSQADTVRRVSPDGIITSYDDATFVTGMAFDRDGNLHLPFRCAVRKIDRRTGAVTTVAGTGQCDYSGDGGPATAAGMNPGDVAFDRAGNLYIADTFNARVRRVDARTGIITTVAGNGRSVGFERGKPAIETAIGLPGSIALDAEDNLFIGNIRVDARSGIATFAGLPDSRAIRMGLSFDAGGNLIGIVQRTVGKLAARSLTTDTDSPITIAGGRGLGEDGLALAVPLSLPSDVIPLPDGNLLFSETGVSLIRKLDFASGRVVRIAGSNSGGAISFEGLPALEATFPPPFSMARDPRGHLYVSTQSSVILKIDAATNIVTRYAGDFFLPGTFSGDGGPATQAKLNGSRGLAVHATGDLFIADSGNHRIRKVDAQTGIITTVVGSGPAAPDPGSFAGDGGPATAARLDSPHDVAFDGAGNLFIADTRNGRIRKVDAVTGTISTIAGGRLNGPAEGPALQVDLTDIRGLHSDAAGNLWFTLRPGAVRRFDAGTGLVSIVAGTGRSAFTGDGGPARAAGLNETIGVGVDARGNVFIPDRSNNRIRAVFACAPVAEPSLTSPVDDAAGTATAPALTWDKVEGAFRYDVYLSTSNPPGERVATDLTATSFVPSNLGAGVRYFWRTVAKGDPFCTPFSQASSRIRSFTTAAACEAPGLFSLLSPGDLAGVTPPLQLSWQEASGTSSYDVLLGTTNPPPVAGTTAATSLTSPALAAGTTYYWTVVAHAACDAAKTRTTSVRSFRTAGGCPTPGGLAQTAPPSGATNVAGTTSFEWTASPDATSYDLYLGTSNPPPIYLPSLTSSRITVSSLTPGATYFWRVVARAGCDPARTSSTPIASFTVRTACTPPQSVAFTLLPSSSIAKGQSYVVSWNAAANLEPGGYYILERASDPLFATIADSQQTVSTSASLIAPSPGTWFHRVRPVNPCSGGSGPTTQSKALTVVPAPPNIVFTVQPEPVLTTLGQNLEDKRARFVVENIGSDPVAVIMARQEIDSPPFFTIVDPFGGDSTFFSLDPRKPKEFEIRFSGPPNDKPASYQGVVLLAALGKPLTITPYAFVSLRVGGGEASAPQFQSGGTRTEYAFFPGFTGDDASRPPITVEIHNPGTTPMELGAEIGPEVWLVPESGWNTTAIAPGVTRSVRLFTRRNRAPNGSALPRYTYFTVRTKSGLSARLLVQDNDLASTASGRGAALDPSIRSLIVPEVVSSDAKTFSTLRLSNLGSEPVQTELFFTPADADGFDEARVRRATITIPPNDVVALTDPLAQLWGLARPAKGQIEVRAPLEKSGFLSVNSVVTRAADAGGSAGYGVPIVSRGDGARTSQRHSISGITTDANVRAILTLAESSGTDRTTVRLTLYDNNGTQLSERTVDVPRYGMTEVSDLAVSATTAARLEIDATSGAGSVIGVMKLLDATTGGGAVVVSRPIVSGASTSALHRIRMFGRAADTPAPYRYFVPLVVNGPVISGSSQRFQTVAGFGAPGAASRLTLTYRDAAGTAKTATLDLASRKAVEYRNILEQLLGVASGSTSEGSLLVESTAPVDVYARLVSVSSGTSLATAVQSIPVIAGDSELVTSGSSQQPLYLEGLDQSTDPSRGNQWSLFLSEIGGKQASVVIRLYEAGNRTSPIAEQEIALPSLVRVKLDNVFEAIGLASASRQKDRANMLLSIVSKSGAGIATALAVATDNRTGSTRSFVLAPGSTGPAGGEKVTAVAPPAVPRKRVVRH